MSGGPGNPFQLEKMGVKGGGEEGGRKKKWLGGKEKHFHKAEKRYKKSRKGGKRKGESCTVQIRLLPAALN